MEVKAKDVLRLVQEPFHFRRSFVSSDPRSRLVKIQTCNTQKTGFKFLERHKAPMKMCKF